MAARTYAPQFARLCKQLAKYYQKHQTKIEAACSPQQASDGELLVSTINKAGGWNSVPTTEQP